MKKIFSMITLIAIIVSCSTSAFAGISETEVGSNPFLEQNYAGNLVNELRKIDFNDEEKVEKTLELFYQSNKSINSCKNSIYSTRESQSSEKTEYMLDKETKVIFDSVENFGIMTIITEDNENKEFTKNIVRSSRSSAIHRSQGTKKFKSYGLLGNTLFTVKIKYKFRAANDIVEVKEGKCWITPGFLSVWTGNVWTEKNPGTASEAANVNSYGTASWSVPLSELVGVPLNVQSVDYDAYVYFDNNGKVTYDIDYEKTGL